MPRKTDSLAEPVNLGQKFQELYDTVKEVLNDLSLNLQETGVKTNSKGDQIVFLLGVESLGDMFTIILSVVEHKTGRYTFQMNVAEQISSMTSCIVPPGYTGFKVYVRNLSTIKTTLHTNISAMMEEFCTDCMGKSLSVMVNSSLSIKTDVPNFLGRLFLYSDLINATQIQELKIWYDKVLSQKGYGDYVGMDYLYEMITKTFRHNHPSNMYNSYTRLSSEVMSFLGEKESSDESDRAVEGYKEIVSTLLTEEIGVVVLQEINEPQKEEEVTPQVQESSYPAKLLQTVKFE